MGGTAAAPAPLCCAHLPGRSRVCRCKGLQSRLGEILQPARHVFVFICAFWDQLCSADGDEKFCRLTARGQDECCSRRGQCCPGWAEPGAGGAGERQQRHPLWEPGEPVVGPGQSSPWRNPCTIPTPGLSCPRLHKRMFTREQIISAISFGHLTELLLK